MTDKQIMTDKKVLTEKQTVEHKQMKKTKPYKKWLPYLIFILVALTVTWLTYHNSFLYSRPIGKVTDQVSTFEKSVKGFDGRREHLEKYYNQVLTVKILNGQHKGETVKVDNNYTSSHVYDNKYHKGQLLFVDNIKDGSGQDGGLKRDYLVALALFLVVGVFLLVGGKEGVFVVFSLAVNMVLFYGMIKLYLAGINILVMAIPLSILFSFLLVVFMYGFKANTWLSMVASTLTLALTLGITYFFMLVSPNIDYDFMDYLQQPYEQKVADTIFLSQITIAAIGAIMDMVVTLVITADQIYVKGQEPSLPKLLGSLRSVGDQIVGTMIAIMFFTNIATSLPFALLSLRNGIALATILRYHSFFSLARFLTGSIAIVLSIPVTTGVLYVYYKWKEGENAHRS